MSLKKFIDQENAETAMWVRSPAQIFDIKNLTEGDKKALAGMLASALSPENLCCDGELRGARLRAKAKLLNDAKRDLITMGVTHDWW